VAIPHTADITIMLTMTEKLFLFMINNGVKNIGEKIVLTIPKTQNVPVIRAIRTLCSLDGANRCKPNRIDGTYKIIKYVSISHNDIAPIISRKGIFPYPYIRASINAINFR
jgi:hypothetical protein